MTEIELRNAVCRQARAWLGRKEADGSHREIIDLYNRYRKSGDYKITYVDPWCAAFVSAVGMAVSVEYGLPGKPYELIPSSAACDPMISQYKALGRWVEDDNYLPTPGDVILYDWEDTGAGENVGSSDHVGIVVDVNGTGITVIEGNKSDMVTYRTISRGGRYIRGYGIPNYGSAAAGATGSGQAAIILDEPGTPAAATPLLTAGFPMLRQGDKGEIVRAAQLLLNGRYSSCGMWGADGDFGPATKSATLAFQRRNNLQADGIIGPQTWAALLGF